MTYYANDADAEQVVRLMAFSSYPAYRTVMPEGTWMTVVGTVTDIDGREYPEFCA
ncbi:hypothetical protein [Kordiimonas aestuarii]|uniref:hypothetical protein n=1 Tax=Kordiimonas aestuarii TaxID=1005925 RepID=UPI0021CFA2C6|nr:hypothetical protein [Kordiimonas aestuarii]